MAWPSPYERRRLITRWDLRTGLLVMWVAVIVVLLLLLGQLALAAFRPEVCVGSMTVEIGQEPVVNPVTCR
jgi:hypothetical protein